MRRSILKVAVLLLVVVAGTAGTSRADSILIRSGSIGFDTGDPPTYGFLGEGLELSGLFPSIASSGTFGCVPQGCAPGSVVNLSTVFGSELTDFRLGMFAGTVEGTTYDFAPDRLLRGTFSFLAPDVTVPDAGDIVRLTAPFTFRGRAAGFEGSSGIPLFDLDLTGRGRVSFLMQRHGNSYGFLALGYGFTPAVVPEPATLMLFGGGLAALWIRRRSGAQGKGGSTN